jgi:septum formation protein
MEDCNLPLILASASPRRKALLSSLGVDFEVIVSYAKEIDEGTSPTTIVEENACAKCDEYLLV